MGAVKIAEYLESDLASNRLNDDDAILILHALKRNTNLVTIHLHSNNITSIGVKALLTCAFDSSSLNAISESNHTLAFVHMFYKRGNESLVGCIDSLLRMDRIEKILLALNDKESLLKYLANIPVELMSEVLAPSNNLNCGICPCYTRFSRKQKGKEIISFLLNEIDCIPINSLLL